MNGRYGTAYTIGVQVGADPRYLQAVSTLKHDFAYSLENSDGRTRHNFNAIVTNATLAEIYFPAFRAAITNPVSPAKGMMCSYNAVNGVPSCANTAFQETLVRGVWGLTGYISSDTDAIDDMYLPDGHHYVKTSGEAACAALRGSTDICSGAPFIKSLTSAVAAGLCPEADVTRALTRTMTLRMNLGLFDPIESQPYWHVPITAVGTASSLDASRRAARASMILLKSSAGVLPLARGLRLAVIGPHNNATDALVGSYLGQLCEDDTFDCVETPAAALAAANTGGTVQTAAGCAINSTSESGFAAAVALASASDAVVLMLGIDDSIEAESNDRLNIDLPATQHKLVAAVAAAAAGKPVVIVLLNGGCVDISPEAADARIGAIIAAGYPGQFGASAIADTIFGANLECCGKTSTTWYAASYTEEIMMSEMEWNVGPGRGYRYFTGEPVAAFGTGLALTSFSITNLSASHIDFDTRAPDAAAAPVRVNVTNTGAVTGDTVVFLYSYPPAGPTPAGSLLPLIKQLIDYTRVHLAPGESTVVSFSVAARQLATIDRASAALGLAPGAGALELTLGDPRTPPLHVSVEVGGPATTYESFPIY